MSNSTLDDKLELRCNRRDKQKFLREAEKTGKPWAVLMREFIKAFNEDRLLIKTKETKQLYVSETKEL